MPTSMAARHFTLDSGQQSNIVWRMRANGFEAQPQDLVMTFLGAYRGATRPARLVRRPRHAARRFRLLDGRVAGRAGAHGPPRRAGAIAERPPRLLPPDAPHRRFAGGGRPAHLLLGPRAASRRALDRAVARDPGGAAARARSSGAAPALPRLRLGAGRDVDLAPRPRAGGGGAHRVARRRRVRRASWSAAPPPGSTSPRSPRARGTSTRSTPDTARSSTSSHRPPLAADEHEAFRLRTRLVHVFRRFPALDPELPDELMHAPRFRARGGRAVPPALRGARRPARSGTSTR